MERLGDTLNRMRIREALAHMPLDPSAPPEPAPVCARCRGAGYLRSDVPVGHPDFGKLVPCSCRDDVGGLRLRERLQRLSNLGPLGVKTFETLDRDGRSSDPSRRERFRRCVDRAEAYAREPHGWLVLVGPSGCGKTHLAAAVANTRLAQGEPAVFAVVPDLLDHLRATFSPNSEVAYDDLFESVRTCALLVLDDLGTQSSTAWAQEKLFQVLNHRYNARLPTVVTTNHRLEELDERLRFRLTDTGLSEVLFLDAWELADLRRLGGLEQERLREMTFDSFDSKGRNAAPHERDMLQRTVRVASEFAGSPEGWLVLLGRPGTGKTHLAAAVSNQRLGEGSPAFFVVVPDLLDYLRATYGPDSHVSYDKLFEAIRTAPLLVLDDLGAHSSTPWAQEKLYQLLNFRYNAKLPTVITTNLGWDEIDGRLRARMSDERLANIHELKVPPYRFDDGRPSRPQRGQRAPRNGRE